MKIVDYSPCPKKKNENLASGTESTSEPLNPYYTIEVENKHKEKEGS